ncbi:MAG: helix-turn-helix transcriptional regulator [Ruminococcaceae bacterium]|nr:helix-turn-helix transcriptional regulator [Oscillospiraceae bacterium]
MLGARIGALRRARGLSQAELARLLKISPSAMGMYEQGRREPPVQILVALSRQLQVSTDFLLTGQAVTAEEVRLLSALLGTCVETADRKLDRRPDRPFSRQELAALFAALLAE